VLSFCVGNRVALRRCLGEEHCGEVSCWFALVGEYSVLFMLV
jgi:hypothetical protein